MRRRISFIAAAAITSLVLAGCASGGNGGDGGDNGDNGGESAGDRGPITFAMGANDTGKIVPIIEAWNADHPDEQVTLAELPQEADGQRDTLVQSLQAQSGDYDIMALDVTWTAEFAAQGWLEPLEGDYELDTSALLPATVDSATYMDTLYAAPQNTNAQLLFYRTDIVETAPTTWDELLSYRDAADEADLDLLVLQLRNYEGLTVQTTQMINAYGGAVVGADGQTPEVNSPEAIEAIQALADAYENGDIPQAANGFTEEQTNLSFIEGDSVFAYNWPYMYDTAKNEPTSVVGDDFDVAAIVGPNGPGASTLGGYNNGINVNSEYKGTAFDFIQFILSEENQRSFAEQSFPPVLASIYEDEALIEQFPYLPALGEALENAQPRPVSPYYASLSRAIADNAYAAIVEGTPVEQAVADMEAAIIANTGG